MSPKAKYKTSKKGGQSGDPCAFFKRATAQVFEMLTPEFGLTPASTIQYMPECVVKYENETTRIAVTYELNSQVTVSVIKLSRTGSEVIEDKSYDLLLLMELRRPETDVHKFSGTGKDWNNHVIEELLREYASFLREEARDVLAGDFSIFPALKELGAHYRRQANKEFFGTYSGVSPRFNRRPTLDEIFAGSNNRQQEFHIYEAYWDHNYPEKEIASFLNVTEETVRRALADFDDGM